MQKTFLLNFGVIIGLASSIGMLFLFSRIWVYGSSNVFVNEPNIFILSTEIGLMILGIVIMSHIIYSDHAKTHLQYS